MDSSQNQNDKDILADWNYTREEWNAFGRWNAMRKGIFNYILHRVLPSKNETNPGVKITGEKIIIGNSEKTFNDANHHLRRVNIRDAGSLNIMEISFRSGSGYSERSEEIPVPVPKGKLREAIALQEILMKQHLL